MIIDVDCPFCDGLGKIHSPGCNGDPDDDGVECPRCGGDGCVAHDLNEDADEDEE